MLPNFEDRVVVVTGGGGWLGAAMSALAVELGAKTFVVGRNREPLEAVLGAIPMICDVGDDRQVSDLLDHVVEVAGSVDGWVNNAYSGVGGGPMDQSRDQLVGSVTRGLVDVIAATQQVSKRMRHGGSIVNIGSMYGLVSPQPDVYEGFPEFHNPPGYGAAKAGVIQYTRYAALHLASRGIRVNSVTPGPFPQDHAAEFGERLAARVPLGRVGLPHEVAGAVMFLLSDWASYITGHNLVVDGGWTAW